MTRIIEIAGIRTERALPSRSDIASELNQRAKLVKPSAFVDTVNLSEGEMQLFLLAQRAKMLSEFFPDLPMYRQDFEAKRDVLFNGLHTLGISNLAQRLQSQPASGWRSWDEKPRNPSAGIKLLFDDVDVAGIGEITQLNCEALYPVKSFQQWKVQTGQNDPDAYELYRSGQEALQNKCEVENKWRNGLNKYWEKGSTAIICNSISNNNFYAGLNPIVAARIGAKQGNHKETFKAIKDASRISQSNLMLWYENGHMNNCITEGIGPMTGIEYLNNFKETFTINGFFEAIINIAIDIPKHSWNQWKNFIALIKGDQNLKQTIEQHVTLVTEFFKAHVEDVKTLIDGKDFEMPKTTCLSNADCPTGWHCEGGICVPDVPGNDCPVGQYRNANGDCVPVVPGDGNFWDNLSQTQRIGLGVAAAGAALLLTRK